MVEVLENDLQRASSKAAFSSSLDDLTAALSLLFIRNNASGRNKFREKWPQVALYLFGEDLIRYDNEGATEFEHREHRTKLEEEAGLRRIDLKRTIAELEEKSVKSGALEFEYVGSVIDKYGAEISVLLYAENIVERVRPGLVSKKKAEQQNARDVLQQEETRKESDLRQRAARTVSAPSPILEDVPVSSAVLENVFDLEDDKHVQAQEKKFLRNPPEDLDNREANLSKTMTAQGMDILDDIRPIETSVPPVQTLQRTLPIKGTFVSVFNVRAAYVVAA